MKIVMAEFKIKEIGYKNELDATKLMRIFDAFMESIRNNVDVDENHYLVMCTHKGIIKRTRMIEFANLRKKGMAAITLDEGDTLEYVAITEGNNDLNKQIQV